MLIIEAAKYVTVWNTHPEEEFALSLVESFWLQDGPQLSVTKRNTHCCKIVFFSNNFFQSASICSFALICFSIASFLFVSPLRCSLCYVCAGSLPLQICWILLWCLVSGLFPSYCLSFSFLPPR